MPLRNKSAFKKFGCATRFLLRAIKALKEMLLTSFYQQYSFIIFNTCKTILNVQNEDRKELCPLQIRGLLFKFVDFLYSRSEVFDLVIKVISSENIFFSLSFHV